MKRTAFITAFVMIALFTSSKLNAQCFGSDFFINKLAQSGVFVGYGIQSYDPSGLNNYIESYNSKYSSVILSKMGKFGNAVGFKVGANLIQIQLEDITLALKLTYQQMKEKNTSTAFTVTTGRIEEEYSLTMNSIGLGFSTSLVISRRFSIKLPEAMVTWNSAKFVDKYSSQSLNAEQTLKSKGSNLGFTFGTGLTYFIVPTYLSVEGVGGYAFISVPRVFFDDGEVLSQTPDGGGAMENFIRAGGFFAFLNVTLSIPFK